MSIIEGFFGTNGLAGSPFGGGPRTSSAVAELPEDQYRRILQAQEAAVRDRFGKQDTGSIGQSNQAQAEIDRLQALRQARAAFLAQQIGQEETSFPATDTASAEADPGQAAIDAFRKFMNMTPEERMFELLLKKRGLTKEEFEALPPEEREKILAEIEDEIRQKIEKKSASTGTGDDTTGPSNAPAVAQAQGRTGAGSKIDAAGSAATLSQADITALAERRSPTGKAGFEDLLILATGGRERLSRLTGESPPGDTKDPVIRKPDKAADDVA